MSLIRSIAKSDGKVYAVGDIHGCYDLLMNCLDQIGFNFKSDLLIAVGDLVDRGHQNIQCVELLSKPWFVSVLGNHEMLCIQGLQNESYKQCHVSNGGEWFYALDEEDMVGIAQTFSRMPIAIELERNGKLFGFVHGHIEQNNWDDFKESFDTFDGNQFTRSPVDTSIWGRDRTNLKLTQYSKVSGVEAVILGHTVFEKPVRRDNCYYIDTGAFHFGNLTIIDIDEVQS